MGDKGFRREIIGEEDAFLEGQREAAARLDPRDVRRQIYLPCVGGPQDGRLFRIPVWQLRDKNSASEVTIPASPSGLEKHLPLEQRHWATYRIDRSSRILRYVRTHKLGG
ncbi:MAG TPA: hypothetical protein VJP59_00205 [Gemmatimonadota bacterium]|nr:hypothetical protein [Gemmatimonadota bacterium]